MNLKQKIIAFLLALVALIGGGSTLVGSISDGGAYTYTSVVTASVPASPIKIGQGMLGSVVITGAAAGYMEFYDATTTNGSLRTIVATSSLRKIASFPASTAAGTYVFDVAFTQGLVAAVVGAVPTTTVTIK